MVTHRVLFQKFGEISYSAPDPVRAFVDGKDEPLLLEKHGAILSSDDWRAVEVQKYEVHEVTLPAWLPLDEWIAHTTAWKYAWGLGVDPSWPESWQRGLAYGIKGSAERIAACKLLATLKFRSEFRQAMRDRIVAWLDCPSGERQYRSPLSARQWDAVLGPYGLRDARRREEGLYRCRSRACGVPLPARAAE